MLLQMKGSRVSGMFKELDLSDKEGKIKNMQKEVDGFQRAHSGGVFQGQRGY